MKKFFFTSALLLISINIFSFQANAQTYPDTTAVNWQPTTTTATIIWQPTTPEVTS